MKLDEEVEGAKHYLERIGMVRHLKISLKQLNATRGEAPYRLMAAYFTMIADQRGEPGL